MKLPVFSSTIRRKEMDAVLTCMVAEKIGPGEINQKLVQYIKETYHFEGAAAFRSPPIAFQYVLAAFDIPKGARIIISALAPTWQYHSIVSLGYVPIIIDVDVETAQLDSTTLNNAIVDGARLIILHHALGFIPNFEPYAQCSIPIIEDISLSFSASFLEKKAGFFGSYAILGLEEKDFATAGGGALLLCANKREAIVLNKLVEESPSTDLLPDINSALGLVQLKEIPRNQILRKELYEMYVRSLMQGRHKTFIQSDEGSSSLCCFPVILSSGLKEVKQYVSKKDIEIELAFSGSIAELLGDSLDDCIKAKSLLMRCVLFPFYPRLSAAHATKIAKVLATLP